MHPSRRVVERFDSHGLGEPTRRIDGEHHDGASSLGRTQCQGRGGRGLADPTRPAADDDAGFGVVEQRVDVQVEGHVASRALGAASRKVPAISYNAARSTPAANFGKLDQWTGRAVEHLALAVLEFAAYGVASPDSHQRVRQTFRFIQPDEVQGVGQLRRRESPGPDCVQLWCIQ